jgi:hypothetical protein
VKRGRQHLIAELRRLPAHFTHTLADEALAGFLDLTPGLLGRLTAYLQEFLARAQLDELSLRDIGDGDTRCRPPSEP